MMIPQMHGSLAVTKQEVTKMAKLNLKGKNLGRLLLLGTGVQPLLGITIVMGVLIMWQTTTK